jgi:hypothetical protein
LSKYKYKYYEHLTVTPWIRPQTLMTPIMQKVSMDYLYPRGSSYNSHLPPDLSDVHIRIRLAGDFLADQD